METPKENKRQELKRELTRLLALALVNLDADKDGEFLIYLSRAYRMFAIENLFLEPPGEVPGKHELSADEFCALESGGDYGAADYVEAMAKELAPGLLAFQRQLPISLTVATWSRVACDLLFPGLHAEGKVQISELMSAREALAFEQIHMGHWLEGRNDSSVKDEAARSKGRERARASVQAAERRYADACSKVSALEGQMTSFQIEVVDRLCDPQLVGHNVWEEFWDEGDE